MEVQSFPLSKSEEEDDEGTTMAATKIPVDVLINILRRLPLVSLIRFRFVSKSWYALITHPSTFTPPFHRIAAKSQKLLLIRQPQPSAGKDFCSLNFNNETLDEYMKLEFPVSDRSLKLVGSCNGLICLTGDDQYGLTDSVVLWNPTIQKFLTIPKPTSPPPPLLPPFPALPGLHNYVTGFGHDPKTNDYKVVRILHLPTDFDWSKDRYGLGAKAPPAEVYSLSERSWRTIEAARPYRHWDSAIPTPSYYRIEHRGSSHAFLNGAVHWIVCGVESESELMNLNSIALFDVGNESFGEMMLPERVELGGLFHRVCLMVVEESLAMIEYCLRDQRCCVWIMNEYGQVNSWTNKYTISLPQGYWSEGNWGVVGFPKDNSALVVRRSGQELVSINATTGAIKRSRFWGSRCSIYEYDYKESLVLLNEADEAQLGHSTVWGQVGIGRGGITERSVAETEEQGRGREQGKKMGKETEAEAEWN